MHSKDVVILLRTKAGLILLLDWTRIMLKLSQTWSKSGQDWTKSGLNLHYIHPVTGIGLETGLNLS